MDIPIAFPTGGWDKSYPVLRFTWQVIVCITTYWSTHNVKNQFYTNLKNHFIDTRKWKIKTRLPKLSLIIILHHLRKFTPNIFDDVMHLHTYNFLYMSFFRVYIFIKIMILILFALGDSKYCLRPVQKTHSVLRYGKRRTTRWFLSGIDSETF